MSERTKLFVSSRTDKETGRREVSGPIERDRREPRRQDSEELSGSSGLNFCFVFSHSQTNPPLAPGTVLVRQKRLSMTIRAVNKVLKNIIKL